MGLGDVDWAAIAAGVVGGADACLPSCCRADDGSDDREGAVLAYQRALLAACEAAAMAVGLHTCRVVVDASGSTEIAYANSLTFLIIIATVKFELYFRCVSGSRSALFYFAFLY